MTFTEDGYFKVGGVQSPLTTSTTNSFLQDADPALFRMLQFYQNVIERHALPRWNVQVAASGRADLVNRIINSILPYDPAELLQENQFRFPLLAIFPVSEDYEYLTTTWYHVTRRMNLIFLMPPINSEQMELMSPFLSYVSKILLDRTLEGLDQFVNNGEQYWNEAQIERIGLTNSLFGRIPKGPSSNLFFPALQMEIEVVERRMYASENFEPFTGFDGYISNNNNDGYAPIEMVDITENF